MKLAIWNYAPADFLVSGLTSGAVDSPFTIERHRPEVCAKKLVEGDVEMALLPTTMALQAYDDIDAIPSVGLVAWKYPYAKLVWDGGLHDFPETIAYDRRHPQERLVARVVLHEHYKVDPTFVPYEGMRPRDLQQTNDDAALLVGPEVATLQAEAFSMDLGREWYELANYPMVWGLLATHRGEADDELIERVISAVKAAEQHRDMWIQAQETPAALNEFYQEDLRVRIDRLGTASLTELRTYMFYYDVMDEIPDVPFADMPDEDDEEEGEETETPKQ